MRRRRTLVSHFWNEEYLLPWWLRHHRGLFDHGVLIDRGSTDRSVAICRELAPGWEVRPSKVPEFDAMEVDREVMEIEREIDGWKMALNTTEFLCVRDPEEFYAAIERWRPATIAVPMALVVDDPDRPGRDPVERVPLVLQRHRAVFEPPKKIFGTLQARFLHRRPDGRYSLGRHWSAHPFVVHDRPGAARGLVLKFLSSPWNEPMLRRKLRIGATLSKASREIGAGVHHLWNREQLEQEARGWFAKSRDLRGCVEHQDVFGRQAFGPPFSSRRKEPSAEKTGG